MFVIFRLVFLWCDCVSLSFSLLPRFYFCPWIYEFWTAVYYCCLYLCMFVLSSSFVWFFFCGTELPVFLQLLSSDYLFGIFWFILFTYYNNPSEVSDVLLWLLLKTTLYGIKNRFADVDNAISVHLRTSIQGDLNKLKTWMSIDFSNNTLPCNRFVKHSNITKLLREIRYFFQLYDFNSSFMATLLLWFEFHKRVSCIINYKFNSITHHWVDATAVGRFTLGVITSLLIRSN